MKWIAEIKEPVPMRLIIEHDKLAGYYLYVYKNGHGIRDDLQDTLEWAMRVALNDYGVPLDAWQQVEG